MHQASLRTNASHERAGCPGTVGLAGPGPYLQDETIDRRGMWWRGADFDDLAEYVREYTAGSYPVDQIRESVCVSCGGMVFGQQGDQDQGAVQRTCRACGVNALIADSDENWADSAPRTCKCPCGGLDYNVAVGFSLRDSREVRWVTVAQRCTTCGILGSFADWRINYAPAPSCSTGVAGHDISR